MGVVCSFRLSFSRFGPLAQWLLDLSCGVDGLADDFEEVLLRLDDEDGWELVLLLIVFLDASPEPPPSALATMRGEGKR